AGDDEDDIELSGLLTKEGSEFGHLGVMSRVSVSQCRVPVLVEQNTAGVRHDDPTIGVHLGGSVDEDNRVDGLQQRLVCSDAGQLFSQIFPAQTDLRASVS